MDVDEQAARGIALLWAAGVPIAAGLSGAELGEVQARFGFVFAAEHAALLRAGLPAGAGWPDWRSAAPAELSSRMSRPVEGVLFDVISNAFWPASWGSRPGGPDELARIARAELAGVPRLIPLYGHRYLPAAPAPDPAPVFSVMQTDVVCYGRDLLSYLGAEFTGSPRRVAGAAFVPFWSELAGRDGPPPGPPARRPG